MSHLKNSKMLIALKQLRIGLIPRKNFGICLNLDLKLPNFNSYQLYPAFKSWEHFSGNERYPIPSTNSQISAECQYAHTENKWDAKTEYVRLRYELLDHLINYFTEHPNEPS